MTTKQGQKITLAPALLDSSPVFEYICEEASTMAKTPLFFFFIDGIGLGHKEQYNQLTDLFRPLAGKGNFHKDAVPFQSNQLIFKGIDACLGVQGRPQSATGQSAIMTGKNTARELGYHLFALPDAQLVTLIQQNNIMKHLASRGLQVTSANLYSEGFFKRRRYGSRNRMPVSTLTIESSGCGFRMIEDYTKGRAVFADITHHWIRNKGIDLPLITPEEAAAHARNIIDENDFTFFEYFLTDLYGHKRDAAGLSGSVQTINRFLAELLVPGGQRPFNILITSDHGNAENIGKNEHTTNQVPFIFYGDVNTRHMDQAVRVNSITDVYDFICCCFDLPVVK